MDSSTPLHKQYLFTKDKHSSNGLMSRSFPKLFPTQKNQLSSRPTNSKELQMRKPLNHYCQKEKKALTKNFSFLETNQVIPSSASRLIKCLRIFCTKAFVISNSQSWNYLEKQRLKWPSSPSYSHLSTTHNTFELLMTNKVGKDSFSKVPPHHLANQNLFLLSFPTKNQTLQTKTSQFFLVAFQKATP